MSRPTIYSDEIRLLAEDYLEKLPDDEVIHSIEGLAQYINVSRSNIYLWAGQEDKPEFSDILERVREKQARELINKGLQGTFAPTITKVILTKHGYREGLEHTGDEGGALKIDISSQLNKVYGGPDTVPDDS
jgi:hypothetical protein